MTQANGTQPQLDKRLDYLGMVYHIDPVDPKKPRPGYWNKSKPQSVAEVIGELPADVRERMANTPPRKLIEQLEEGRTWEGFIFLRRTLLDYGMHPDVVLDTTTRLLHAVQMSNALAEGDLERAVAHTRDWLHGGGIF